MIKAEILEVLSTIDKNTIVILFDDKITEKLRQKFIDNNILYYNKTKYEKLIMIDNILPVKDEIINCLNDKVKNINEVLILNF